MKKGMILYQSKYGATKKYAQWLRDMTGYDCMETAKASAGDVLSCENLVLCGGIYASGITGLSFLKKNIGRLQGKKIAVFCVGASPYEERVFSKVKEHNMKGDLAAVPLFYGRGAWEESRMTFTDRTLCRLLQKSVAKKDPSTYEPWMQALMCAAGQTCDWTDKAYLTPLLEFLG